MHGNASLRNQRNRLYEALREQGASGSHVLEESRKLDALVLRYYRTALGTGSEKSMPAESKEDISGEPETYDPDNEEIHPGKKEVYPDVEEIHPEDPVEKDREP